MRHRPTCVACKRWATREVRLDGEWQPFCDRCPSPRELLERAAAVRAKWSDETYAARALGMDVREYRAREPAGIDSPENIVVVGHLVGHLVGRRA